MGWWPRLKHLGSVDAWFAIEGEMPSIRGTRSKLSDSERGILLWFGIWEVRALCR